MGIQLKNQENLYYYVDFQEKQNYYINKSRNS